MKLFEDGDPCFAPMLNALFAAFRGTAVMSGCEVSATGTSRTVSITAGSVQINGEVVAVEAGSVTLDAGSTFDRYDLVSVNASGSKIVTKGAVKRKCPTQPANTCLLAIVFVPAGATVIATGDVYDARMLSQNLAAAAIECAGALQNQTGNIGARTGFVDVPGDVVRKTFTPNIVINSTESKTIVSFTIPADYSTEFDSNLRIGITKTSTDYLAGIWFVIERNGVQIGTGSMNVYYDSYKTFDTTGGCKAGDAIVIKATYGGDGRDKPVTITKVEVKAARKADIPAYKVFAETGAW